MVGHFPSAPSSASTSSRHLVWGFCCQGGEIDGVLIYWKPRRFVSVRRPSLIDRHESGSDGLRTDGREPERSEGNLPSG